MKIRGEEGRKIRQDEKECVINEELAGGEIAWIGV